MLSWDVLGWLLLLASCHQPASQAMGLRQLHWLISHSTSLLPDIGEAPGSQDRLRDTSKPNELG